MHVGACRCTCRCLEGKNRERGRKEKEGSSPATRTSPWQPNQNPPPCTFHHKPDIHLYCHSKMKWCPSGPSHHHMCKIAAQLKLNFTPILERIRDTRSLNLHLISFVFLWIHASMTKMSFFPDPLQQNYQKIWSK